LALNWREIDFILDELELEGALINQIHQPSHQSLVLELYGSSGPLKLFVSLSNPHCRIHTLSRRLANPERPPRFTSFLRAHIRNGRIQSISQIGAERIVKILIRREAKEVVLWIRLWASAANIIAADPDGLVLDAFYRRPRRGEISGGRFELPGPGDSATRKRYMPRDFPGDGSYNTRVEAYFFQIEEDEKRESHRQKALSGLAMKENRILARLERLEERQSTLGDDLRLRELGDLLKGNLHRIKKGDKWLDTEDYFHSGSKITIELDPRLTPPKNVESYYTRYRKAKGARQRIDRDTETLKRELRDLRQRKARMDNDADFEVDIAPKAPPASKIGKIGTGLAFSSHQYRIIVGRTASENEQLLRRHVNGNDYWFHSRDYPGSYVFVKSIKGKSLPLETMLDAGNLAIFYSKAKKSGQGDIYYTQVKHLRRARAAKTGLVLPMREKNLYIKLDPVRLQRLRKSKS
jgi:predicted ribosome quality control (RQC) complex YloA/Tae2 family protein